MTNDYPWKCPNCYLNNYSESCTQCGCYPAYVSDRYRDDLYGPRVGVAPWYTKVANLFTKKD